MKKTTQSLSTESPVPSVKAQAMTTQGTTSPATRTLTDTALPVGTSRKVTEKLERSPSDRETGIMVSESFSKNFQDEMDQIIGRGFRVEEKKKAQKILLNVNTKRIFEAIMQFLTAQTISQKDIDRLQQLIDSEIKGQEM